MTASIAAAARSGCASQYCNEFYALIRESDSTLLLGMRGGYGLIRFDMRTKKYVFVDMHRLQSRALGDLLCLCKSRESGLYCGASSGLILLTPEGDIRQFNRRNGIVNYIMGLCFVTEGAIPYAAADPLRVLPSCVIGAALSGALSMTFGCALRAPHGGIFVFPVVDHAVMYCVALAVGSVVGAVILSLLKKTRTEE